MSSFIVYELISTNTYTYAQTKKYVNTSFWLSSYKVFALEVPCWILV